MQLFRKKLTDMLLDDKITKEECALYSVNVEHSSISTRECGKFAPVLQRQICSTSLTG